MKHRYDPGATEPIPDEFQGSNPNNINMQRASGPPRGGQQGPPVSSGNTLFVPPIYAEPIPTTPTPSIGAESKQPSLSGDVEDAESGQNMPLKRRNTRPLSGTAPSAVEGGAGRPRPGNLRSEGEASVHLAAHNAHQSRSGMSSGVDEGNDGDDPPGGSLSVTEAPLREPMIVAPRENTNRSVRSNRSLSPSEREARERGLKPEQVHVLRRASTLRFRENDNADPERSWATLPHKYTQMVAGEKTVDSAQSLVALSARGGGGADKEEKEGGRTCFKNPLAPPGLNFRPPPRVPSSLQVRRLVLSSHDDLGLKLAPVETCSMTAISAGEFLHRPNAGVVQRERFLELCPAAEALEVYYDGLFIRLKSDPHLAVEVRMFHTWEEYELHENSCHSAGKSSRPFYRDAEKYQHGTEIQVFYHHRYANQMFVLNHDGTLSPKFKPELCIGGLRSEDDFDDIDLAGNTQLNAGGSSSGNIKKGFIFGGAGGGAGAGAPLNTIEETGPAGGVALVEGEHSAIDFREGTHSAPRKGALATKLGAVQEAKAQMGGGHGKTMSFLRSKSNIDPEKMKKLNLMKRQGTAATLSNLVDDEVKAMQTNDPKKLQKFMMERLHDFPDANKVFLVRCRSPLEKLEDQMLMQRFHFGDVTGVPVSGLREVDPANAVKVQLYTSAGVPLVIMQKVLGNVVYLGKHVKDVANVEMIEMLDNLLTSGVGGPVGGGNNVGAARTPSGSSSFGGSRTGSSPRQVSGRGGNGNYVRDRDNRDDAESSDDDGSPAGSSGFGGRNNGRDSSSAARRGLLRRQWSTLEGHDLLSKRIYNPKVALEMEYKFSDKEMKAALERKVKKTQNSSMLVGTKEEVQNIEDFKKQKRKEQKNNIRGIVQGNDNVDEDQQADNANGAGGPSSSSGSPPWPSSQSPEIPEMQPGGVGAPIGQNRPSAGFLVRTGSVFMGDASTGPGGGGPTALGSTPEPGAPRTTTTSTASHKIIMPDELAENGEPDAEPMNAENTRSKDVPGGEKSPVSAGNIDIVVDQSAGNAPAGQHVDIAEIAASLPAPNQPTFMFNTSKPANTLLGRIFQRFCGNRTRKLKKWAAEVIMDFGSDSEAEANEHPQGFNLESHDPTIRYFGNLSYIARFTARELRRMAEFRVAKLSARYDLYPDDCVHKLLSSPRRTETPLSVGGHNTPRISQLSPVHLMNAEHLAREARKEADWYLAAETFEKGDGSGTLLENKCWNPLEVYFSAKKRTLRLASAPNLAIDCDDALASETPLLCKYCTGADSQRFVVNPDGTVSPIYRRDLCWGFSKTGKIIMVSVLDVARRLHLKLEETIPLDESVCRLGPERIFRFDMASHRGWGVTMKVSTGKMGTGDGLKKHAGQKPVPTISPDSVLEIFFDGPFLRWAQNPHAALCYSQVDHDVEFSAITNYADDSEIHRYTWTLHPNRIITPQKFPEFCLGTSLNMRRLMIIDTEMLTFPSYARGKLPLLLDIEETAERPFDFPYWQAQNLMLHVQRKVANRNSTALLTGLAIRVELWPRDWDVKLFANPFRELILEERGENEHLETKDEGFFFQNERIHSIQNMQEVWTVESRDGSELRVGDRVVVEKEDGIDDFAGGKVWDAGEFEDHHVMAFQRWQLNVNMKASVGSLAEGRNKAGSGNSSSSTSSDSASSGPAYLANCTVSPLHCESEFVIGSDKHGFMVLVPPDSPDAMSFRMELLDVASILGSFAHEHEATGIDRGSEEVVGGGELQLLPTGASASPKSAMDTMFRSHVRSDFDQQAYAASVAYFNGKAAKEKLEKEAKEDLLRAKSGAINIIKSGVGVVKGSSRSSPTARDSPEARLAEIAAKKQKPEEAAVMKAYHDMMGGFLSKVHTAVMTANHLNGDTAGLEGKLGVMGPDDAEDDQAILASVKPAAPGSGRGGGGKKTSQEKVFMASVY